MTYTLRQDFFVRPLEPVYFGRPRSFIAGESHQGSSEFPPSLFNFQGLVRSQLLRAVEPPLMLDDWTRSARAHREALVGGPGQLLPGWHLQGPFPTQLCPPGEDDEADTPYAIPWVPTPRFLLASGHGDPFHARPVESNHPGMSDLGDVVLQLGRPERDAVKSLDGWVSPANLRFALEGEGNRRWDRDGWAETLPPFVARERQPGLGLDYKTNTAKEGMLYFLETLRFDKDAGLLGSFSGAVDERIPVTALRKGAGAAGRKGRLVAFEPVDRLHDDWRALKAGEHLPAVTDERQSFWLVALTPARIDNPRKPPLALTPPPGIRIHFGAALTGPPITIGGYQMATRESRPNRLYLPAGSSWLFQLRGGDAQSRTRTLRLLNDQHALGPRDEARMGFGHTLVGIGPLINEGGNW